MIFVCGCAPQVEIIRHELKVGHSLKIMGEIGDWIGIVIFLAFGIIGIVSRARKAMAEEDGGSVGDDFGGVFVDPQDVDGQAVDSEGGGVVGGLFSDRNVAGGYEFGKDYNAENSPRRSVRGATVPTYGSVAGAGRGVVAGDGRGVVVSAPPYGGLAGAVRGSDSTSVYNNMAAGDGLEPGCEIAPIHSSGDSGDFAVPDFEFGADDFDLRRAVIETEILTPKYL